MKRASAAVELRIMGASFTEIAEELGYASRGAAYDAFKKGYAVLTDEIRGEAAEAIKHQLARNIAYRKKVLIQANASGDQIAGAMAALAIDKFDSALREMGPGSAANLDAVPAIAGPDGTSGVCAKCNSPVTALTDPAFEYERIKQINAILLESHVDLVPIKVDDAATGWESESATPAENAPQSASPKAPEGSGVRFARITDRETHDLMSHDFDQNEIL